MYHSARWGGWQYALAARNDSDHSLRFACTLLDADAQGRYTARGGAVPCPTDNEGGNGIPAVVHGG